MEPLWLPQAIEENTLEFFSWLYLFSISFIHQLIRPMRFPDSTAIKRERKDG